MCKEMQKIQHPKIKFLMSGSQSIIKYAKKQENIMHNEGKTSINKHGTDVRIIWQGLTF